MEEVRKIHQSLDIKQLLQQAMGGEQKVNMPIVQITNMQVQVGNDGLFDIIAALPEPRMENLKKMVVRLADTKFRKKKEAWDFLGINHGTYHRLLMEGKKEDQR